MYNTQSNVQITKILDFLKKFIMKKLTPTEDALLQIYTDIKDPAAFSTPLRLFKHARQLGVENITLGKVEAFLKKLPFYQKYKPIRYQKNFPRSKMVFFALNRHVFSFVISL